MTLKLLLTYDIAIKIYVREQEQKPVTEDGQGGMCVSVGCFKFLGI